MVDQSLGFFDLDDQLAAPSTKGDDLERVKGLSISGYFGRHSKQPFRGLIGRRVADRAFDHVLTFKVLILQAMHGSSR